MENNNNNNNNNNNRNRSRSRSRSRSPEDNPLEIYSVPPRGLNWMPVDRAARRQQANANKFNDELDLYNDFLKKKFKEKMGEEMPEGTNLYEPNYYVGNNEKRGAERTRRNRRKLFLRIYNDMKRREEFLRNLRRRNNNN